MKCSNCNFFSFCPKAFRSSLNKDNNFIIFCRKCYKEGKIPNNIQYDEEHSKELKKRVYKIKVSCPNCKWKGEASQLIEHVKNECGFKKVESPKKVFQEQRKDLSNLLNENKKIENENKKIKRTQCKDEIEKPEMTKIKDCGKKPDCKNNCPIKSKKSSKFLPEDYAYCKYYNYGCYFKHHKNDIEAHNIKYNQYHIKLLNKRLNILKGKIKEYEEIKIEINNLKKEEEEIFEKNSTKGIQLKEEEEFEEDGMKENKITNRFLEKPKACKYDNNFYIPYSGESIEFFTDKDTSNKKIIEFGSYLIKYSGQVDDVNHNYFAFSNKYLVINTITKLEFEIIKDDESFPSISFGLCSNKKCLDVEVFPHGFFYVDINYNDYHK